ncbi:MAG: hypothetical protein OEW70_04810 [candidate division WOR-3 bacterium]|nr:hypothetical protein [candidate division WOR-3 bacterium]
MYRQNQRRGNLTPPIFRLFFIGCLAFVPSLFALKFPKPTLSGDFSSYFEAYGSNRATNRRPSTTYRFSLSSSVGFPFFSLGLGLFYTSEDKFTSQRVNQFNLKPAWKWGSIDLGDFSPSFTEYTLSGCQIRGAGISLFPKTFRFSLVGGQSNRPDTINKTYKRTLYGLRLGTNLLGLNILKVKDDEKSLPPTDTGRPQENLVVGIESNFYLSSMLNISLEADGSIHTRDLRSDTFRYEDVPKFIYTFYQPRRSTRIDYALKNAVKFNLKFFTLDLAVNQIGPGYTSLGVPYLKNDTRKGRITVSTQAIPKTSLSLMLERDYDNLVKDKVATTKGSAFGISLRFSPIKKLNIQTNYNQRTMNKAAASDSFKINNLTRGFLISPNFAYNLRGINQNSNITFGYQQFKNSAPISQLISNHTITIGLNHYLSPSRSFSISFSFNRSISFLPQAERSQSAYNLKFNHKTLGDKLNNSVAVSYSPSTIGKNYRLSARNGYSLTKRDVINLDWILNFYSSPGNSFSERQVSLTYGRRIF